MAAARKIEKQNEQQIGKGEARAPRRRVYARKTDIVLEAAEDAFLEAGFANTSMDTIAERAGVSKRTVYSNFKNKEELFAAVIRKRCAGILPDTLHEDDYETDDPEAALTRMATKFLRGILSKRHVELYQTVVAASRRFPAVGAVMYKGPIEDTHRLVERFLLAQIARGNLVLSDPDVAARQFVALLKTNLQMAALFSQPIRVTKKVIEDSARSSVQLFLYGAASDTVRAASRK